MEEPGRPAATSRPHSDRPHSSPVSHPRMRAGGSRLIEALLAGDPDGGVIGKVAREALKRMPSEVSEPVKG